MGNDSRIYGKEIALDSQKVHDFWMHRIEKKLPYDYNLVNFQDRNPERAIKRDRIEKDKIRCFLSIKPGDSFLDIGCGIGRWCDEILPLLETGRYVGIDYTEAFIRKATYRYKDDSRCFFFQGDFLNLNEVLKQNGIDFKFDKVFINGVLMYINDSDIGKCLSNLNHCIKDGGIVYVKESVGMKQRMTLSDYYSDELDANYSVIYRTIHQYETAFDSYIDNKVIYACGPTFEDSIDYQCETSNWFWVMGVGR